VLRLTLKKCFKTFNLENDTRPGNELLTDRHRAAARWLPTTALEPEQLRIFKQMWRARKSCNNYYNFEKMV